MFETVREFISYIHFADGRDVIRERSYVFHGEKIWSYYYEPFEYRFTSYKKLYRNQIEEKIRAKERLTENYEKEKIQTQVHIVSMA